MNDDYDHNVVDVFLHDNHDEEDFVNVYMYKNPSILLNHNYISLFYREIFIYYMIYY